MKTDYPEFSKKPVTYIDYHGNKIDAIVVECNYHIGLTLVAANDHDNYLCCYAGPSSKMWEETMFTNKNDWRKLFHMKVKEIQSGTVKIKTFLEFRKSINITSSAFGSVGAEFCAFA